MRVHEIRIACRVARGTCVGRQKDRKQRELPRRRAQVLRDATAVGDPEVLEGVRRYDVDLDAQRAHTLDARRDEGPCDVDRVAWVRRRENDHFHSLRAKTTGTASASAMNA